SERNTVVVDFEKLAPKAAPYVLPPVSRSNAADPMHALDQDHPLGTGDPVATLGVDQLPMPPEGPVPSALIPAASTSPGTASIRQNAGSPSARLQTPAQAPQLPTAGEQPGASRGGRQYTGHPISLDFQGADLRAVLRVFAEESGLNIVIDPAVQGTVDVALHDVPWDQAPDTILRANKPGYVVDGTIVRIAPLTVLADEEAQRRKLSDEQALAGELRVMTKTLSYAKAEELRDLITKSSLSQRGTVQVDPRTNTLI